MRLLFDHNLSPALAMTLADLFPGSEHVWDHNMDTASDIAIWTYATEHGLTIVTKDIDYRELSLVRGHPPKVVWIRLGNGPTADVEALLRQRYNQLIGFNADDAAALIELP